MSDEPQIIVNWLFNGKFDGAKKPLQTQTKEAKKAGKKNQSRKKTKMATKSAEKGKTN